MHGIGGHAAATWTFSSKQTTNLWLRDFLPKNLERARIMTFGYESAVISRNTAELNDIATSLLHSLIAKRRSDEVYF